MLFQAVYEVREKLSSAQLSSAQLSSAQLSFSFCQLHARQLGYTVGGNSFIATAWHSVFKLP